MKKLITLILAVLLLCAAIPTLAEETPAHVLVIYFSHAGENYNVGVIEEGNTGKMGKIIAEQMGADVFELVPVVPYPEDYDSCLDVATENSERMPGLNMRVKLKAGNSMIPFLSAIPSGGARFQISSTPLWKPMTLPARP